MATVTFITTPGGVPASEMREIYDSLDEATQTKLNSLSARERTDAVLAVAVTRLFGETKASDTHSPVGVSGRMWGNQRAF